MLFLLLIPQWIAWGVKHHYTQMGVFNVEA